PSDDLSLFEVPSAPAEEHIPETASLWRGNPLAVAGAALSFLPPVGAALSGVGLARSRSRFGLGRRIALSGIALSVVFLATEVYLGATAPILDSGCWDASSPASQLRAIQANPGIDLTVLSNELDSIQTALDGAAANAGSDQVRVKLQLVAGDVKTVSDDVTGERKSGDMGNLVVDQIKLETDGVAADAYCHSL
ncbi:MAG: hypothetical protein ACRDVE_09930, partial [Actinocrinis sp.]